MGVEMTLNDGSTATLHVDIERFYCAELLFQPSTIAGLVTGFDVSQELDGSPCLGSEHSPISVQEAVKQSLDICGEELQDLLLHRVVLAGPTFCKLAGFEKRLRRELKGMAGVCCATTHLILMLHEKTRHDMKRQDKTRQDKTRQDRPE